MKSKNPIVNSTKQRVVRNGVVADTAHSMMNQLKDKAKQFSTELDEFAKRADYFYNRAKREHYGDQDAELIALVKRYANEAKKALMDSLTKMPRG